MVEDKKLENNQKKKEALSPSLSSMDDFEKRIRRLVEKGRRRGKRYSIIGITASILITVAVISGGYYLLTEVVNISEKTEKEMRPILKEKEDNKIFVSDEWRFCAQDKDCVETQINCCDCRHGGRQTAINRRYLSQWKKKLAKECHDVSCIAMMACRSGRTVCEQGQCRFKKK